MSGCSELWRYTHQKCDSCRDETTDARDHHEEVYTRVDAQYMPPSANLSSEHTCPKPTCRGKVRHKRAYARIQIYLQISVDHMDAANDPVHREDKKGDGEQESEHNASQLRAGGA